MCGGYPSFAGVTPHPAWGFDRLPENFNQPYLSQSITDFWRRWHMSLSAWLRDYLYFPLGGNRRGRVRTYLNLMIVMGLGGLWHGADWKFAIWGLWHGAWLVIERLFGLGEASSGLVAVFRIVITFSLVTSGWLFFRLSSLEDLVLLLEQFGMEWRPLDAYLMAKADVATIYALSAAVVFFHFPSQYAGIFKWRGLSQAIEPYALGLLVAAIFMASGSRHAFIYFQF